MSLTLSKPVINSMVENINSKDSQLFFKDKNIARLFGKNYMGLQREHWGGNEARARYYLLSKVLRKAMDKKYITKEDLLKTDYEVLGMLYETKNDAILEGLNILKNGFKIREVPEGGIVLKKKFRHVDPEVLVRNEIVPLSSISEEYKTLLDKEKANSKKEVRVEIIY